MRYAKKAPSILLSWALLVVGGGVGLSPLAQITTRTQEPIILTADLFPAFAGVPIDRIRLYTWQMSTGWVRIPSQIDERTLEYLDNNQPAGCQLGTQSCEWVYVVSGVEGNGLDSVSPDELVFMARDTTGESASRADWLGIPGTTTMTTRYRIALQDIIEGEAGYVFAYAWLQDPPTEPVADYVTWTPAGAEFCQVTGDPACGWFRSTGQGSQAGLPSFNLYFAGNWTTSALCIKPPADDENCTVTSGTQNFLDRGKFRTTGPTKSETSWDQVDCRAFMGIKDDLVCPLRRIQGAQSGRHTTKVERFCGTWMDQRINLRVHEIRSINIRNDHRKVNPTDPAAESLSYIFTREKTLQDPNPGGPGDPMDTIDQSPPGAVVGKWDDWVQVDFSRGTYVHWLKQIRVIPNATPTFNYDDSTMGGGNQNDTGQHGTSGVLFSGNPCLGDTQDHVCYPNDPDNDPRLHYAQFTRTWVALPVDTPDGAGNYHSEEGKKYEQYRNAPIVAGVIPQIYTSSPPPPPPPDPPCVPILSGSTSSAGNASDLAVDKGGCTPAFTGIQLYRGLVSGSYEFLSDLGTRTSFRDFDVGNGKTYYYAARAYNSEGTLGAYSNEVVLAVADTTAPSVPGGVTAVPGSGRVILSWDDVPGRDVVGYRVYSSLSSGGPYDLANPEDLFFCGLPTFAANNLTPGVPYYFTVASVDAAGNEPATSLEVSATPNP